MYIPDNSVSYHHVNSIDSHQIFERSSSNNPSYGVHDNANPWNKEKK